MAIEILVYSVSQSHCMHVPACFHFEQYLYSRVEIRTQISSHYEFKHVYFLLSVFSRVWFQNFVLSCTRHLGFPRWNRTRSTKDPLLFLTYMIPFWIPDPRPTETDWNGDVTIPRWEIPLRVKTHLWRKRSKNSQLASSDAHFLISAQNNCQQKPISPPYRCSKKT